MRKSDILGILLLAFVIGCRFHTPLADFYAEHGYPVISAGLSLLASAIPVSLEEVVVVGFILALIVVLSARLSERKVSWAGWGRRPGW